jgi:hypothetical protein
MNKIKTKIYQKIFKNSIINSMNLKLVKEHFIVQKMELLLMAQVQKKRFYLTLQNNWIFLILKIMLKK